MSDQRNVRTKVAKNRIRSAKNGRFLSMLSLENTYRMGLFFTQNCVIL